jgi:hypothetical protein
MALSASIKFKQGGAAEIGRQRFGADVGEIIKAATAPASTGTSAWAQQLATAAVGSFIGLLPSAGGSLIAAGSRLTMDGLDSVSLPTRATTLDQTGSAWIAEGAPSPVKQVNLDSVKIGPPRKLVTMICATREMLAVENAEQVFAALMRENVGFALDYKMFSDDAADDTAPAGLLAGISGLTASAATTADEAMRADLEQLLASIAPASSGKAVIVANPAQAFSIAVRLGRNFAIPVWPSAAVAPGTVIAVDPSAFASGFGSEPQMSASIETALHFEDTSPSPLSTEGTPNAIAAPIRSLFQSDLIGLRLTLKAAWCMRSPAIAWLENCTWGAVPA